MISPSLSLKVMAYKQRLSGERLAGEKKVLTEKKLTLLVIYFRPFVQIVDVSHDINYLAEKNISFFIVFVLTEAFCRRRFVFLVFRCIGLVWKMLFQTFHNTHCYLSIGHTTSLTVYVCVCVWETNTVLGILCCYVDYFS